ncbi:hypothetical protein, variant [Aphanomyces astaci]|uniref:Probable pectate lyase F n=1 Tax=Aphanomyces astaci TaxID=112090 RepID=W4FLR2_APHAT|nr:hypothetical protein, variant [Aphanomyces astaci]ETV67613.1 hypothetical protein, variant [Aphanomyces astaci]|eukprot:XP_009842869.1 hypothetical protein, variant [Aphanomyces astaci]
MSNMQQLMEHLRKIEAGKQTNSRMLRTFQERHRNGIEKDVVGSTSETTINPPRDIYSILLQEHHSPKQASSTTPTNRRPVTPPVIVVPLSLRREKLHEDMARLLVRPSQLTGNAIVAPAPSPPKGGRHSPSKPQHKSSIDPGLQTQLIREQSEEANALRQASDDVAATLTMAQDLIPLSFLLERNMKALCQSKAGAIIQSAFHTFLLHFYADAWQHWKAFVVMSRHAERVAAASFLTRVYRGHRARKACAVLRRQLATLEGLKATAIAQIVTRRSNAALAIQMCFRRHRLQLRKLQVQARHAAATRIQRLTVYNKQRSMALARMLLDARKIHAALKLQKLWRGHCGRRVAARRKVQDRRAKRLQKLSQPDLAIAHRFEAQGAAFRIQGQVRRWLRRRRGRESRAAAREAQAKERVRLLLVRFILRFKRRRRHRQLEADRAVRTKAARLIQRCILQWIQLRKWKLMRMARRKRERQARLALKAKQMNRSQDKVKLPFRAASTAWKLVTRTLRGDKKSPKDVAAVCIQRAWRCAKKRHQVYLKTLYAKLDKAADKRQQMHRHVTRIQKVWRGRRDRRKCTFLWLDKVTRHALAKWKRRRARRRNAAATKIQTKFRVVRAKVLGQAVEHLIQCQHAAARRIQRLVRGRQAVLKVQRQRDARRQCDETLRFCVVALQRCMKLRMDFLAIQSLEGNMGDLVKYPVWLQEQRRFHRSDTSFPIFQILFADYSGLKRELWAGQSAKALAALRLDRSKFVKIFREAFATSDRLMDITSEADRVLAKLKAHPSQSRTSLAFADFVFGIKEMAKLQIKSKKPMDDDDDMKVLQLFWKHLATCKWSKKSKAPDEMKAYTESWLNDQARCIQQMARRQQYQQRGYILMDLKRKEWQNMRAHSAARTIQSLWRTKASRAYMRKLMQTVFRKYIDATSGLPYWTNPRTGYSTWKKPSILGKHDVASPAVPMADDATEYAVHCDNCNIHPIQEMCFQCDEKYCLACFTLLHAKGKTATHQHISIPTCVSCHYQVATRYCSNCKENYCDNCMSYLHAKGTLVYHVAAPLMLLCVDCLGKRAARVHCHTCNKDVCHACAQYHPPEYCHTEPRPFESAPVENERKRLDMIKTNDLFAEEKRIQDAKAFEALQIKCAMRIQRGWRRKVQCKSGVMHMLELHKAHQSTWEKIQRDRQREKQFVYRVKGVFGKAEVLEMDSPTQAILRRLNVYLRHKIEARARALHVALDEYVHLGVPLPGVASIAEGSDHLETSEDLRGWLVPAQALRIQGHVVYAQMVESIGETFIRLSAPYGHMSVDKSVLYSVEFSHDHPTKLKHAASSHAVKVRDLKESKAVTASLRKIGNATQSMALRFDEDSFLGRALNRTAQHIQRSLQRQKFNQSKREREISLLSVQRSFRDRQMYSLRREQSQRWDESSTQRPASIRHVGSIHSAMPGTSNEAPMHLDMAIPSNGSASMANTASVNQPPEEGGGDEGLSAKVDSRTARVVRIYSESLAPMVSALEATATTQVPVDVDLTISTSQGQSAIELPAPKTVESPSSYEIEPSPSDTAMSFVEHNADVLPYDKPTTNVQLDTTGTGYNPATTEYDKEVSASALDYSVPADYYPQQSYTSAAEAYADQPTHDPQGSSQDWQQHVVPPQQPTQDDYQLGYDDYYYDQQNYDQQGYYYQPEIDHSYYTQDSTAYVEGAYIAPTYPSYSPTASVHTSYTEPVAATETEWQEAYDPSSGQVYYYNPRTGESVWHQ